MKNRIKLLGITALVAVMGLILASCGDPVGGGDSDLAGTITIIPSFANVGGTLAAYYTGNETVTYQWKRNGGNIGTASTDAYTYETDQAGTYTVTVSAAGYNSKTSNPVTVSIESGIATALARTIADAQELQKGIEVSDNAASVAQGAFYVSQSDWDAFAAAITAANSALKTATTAEDVETATNALQDAIDAFENAKTEGTKTSDFTAAHKTALIARARADLAGVEAADDGDDIGPLDWWVTEAAQTALETAINTLDAADETNIDSAYLALVSAISVFNEAKQHGSDTSAEKTSLGSTITTYAPFTTAVVVATNAAEVPSGTYWVTRAQMASFNAAIAAATAVMNNSNASKNEVEAAQSDFSEAATTFVLALTVGTKDGNFTGTITITPTTATVGTELTANYSGSETAISYQWKKDGENVGSNSTTYTPAAAGSYTVTVSKTGYNPKTSAAVTVTGSSTDPVPDFPPETFIQLTADVFADGDLPQNGEQWYSFTATAAEQYIHANFTGSMYVQVYNADGTTNGNQASHPAMTPPTPFFISRTVTMGQTYYIKITPGLFGTGGAYNIAFNTTLYPPGATVTPLSVGEWKESNNIPAKGEQWFSFTATAVTQFIHATFDQGVYVQLYNADGTTNGDKTNLSSSRTFISRTVTSGQTYYIRVTPFVYTSNPTCNIAFNATPYPPGVTATSLSENVWADGDMPSTGNKEQWYRFTATAATQFIHAAFGTLSASSGVYVQVYNADGATIGAQTNLYTTYNTNITYTSRPVTVGQTYYIRVTSNYDGTYNITFNATPYPPGVTATSLSENVWADGDMPSTGNGHQWYRFTATAEMQIIRVNFGTLNASSGVYVQVYNADGTMNGEDDLSSSTSTSTSRPVTVGQTYYIRVRPNGSVSGTYSIMFTTDSPTALTNIVDVTEYLNNSTTTGGASADDPIKLTISMDLGTMTLATSNWQLLLGAIEDENKFVELNLSACTMSGGPGFNPVAALTTGKSYIVGITLPTVAQTLTAGTSAESTFNNFTSLKSFKTAALTAISDYAFFNCTSLSSIDLPTGVTSIGASAFSGCSGLTGTLTIPTGVTSIGASAFNGCSGLTGTLTIPTGVTSIGTSAFNGCSGLTSVTIPNSVTNIGNSAFSGCTKLHTITMPFVNTYFGSIFGATAVDATQNTFIPSSLTTVIITSGYILSGMSSIPANAFVGCSGLTSVTIPTGVTSIGSSAFNGCSGLTSVTIPDSVTTINNYAFSACTSLGVVTIGSGVSNILFNAFDGCTNLTNVTIPNSVTNIGNSAFSGTNMKLGYVIFEGDNTTFNDSSFPDGASLLTAYNVGKAGEYRWNGLTYVWEKR